MNPGLSGLRRWEEMCGALSSQDLGWLKWGPHLYSHFCTPQFRWGMGVRGLIWVRAWPASGVKTLSLPAQVSLAHRVKPVLPACVGWALGLSPCCLCRLPKFCSPTPSSGFSSPAGPALLLSLRSLNVSPPPEPWLQLPVPGLPALNPWDSPTPPGPSSAGTH